MSFNEELVKYFDRKLDTLGIMYIQWYFLSLNLRWAREQTKDLSGQDEQAMIGICF